MGADAAGWLEAWDEGGDHRTGTAPDAASAAWLARVAAAMGAAVSLEPFPLERIDPIDCHVEGDGFRIEGAPLFDAPPTGPDGIAGRIQVEAFAPTDVYAERFRSVRAAEDHDGLVIVCAGARPGLGLLNAERFSRPHGRPTVQVETRPPGPVLRLVSHYRRTPAQAANVVVSLPGRDPGLRPVVVMTPRSSWWRSTSERGGGLVCWLETLRALIASPPACDVVLTANSGHELGHLGLEACLAHRPGWAGGRGATWIHFGANLGAVGGALSIQSSEADLQAAMAGALAAAGAPPAARAPIGVRPNGETRNIHDAGGRYVTLVGSNPLFHLPSDRWPYAVDVPAIERIAAGAAAMVRAWAGA